MRKYINLFFSVSLFLTACNWGTPSGIIKPQRMIALLTDLHTADGSLLNLLQAPDTLYKYGTGKYLAVFKKFNTDSTQFKISYKYYTLHPAEFTTIYDSVARRLQLKDDSLTGLLAKQNVADAKRSFTPIAGQGTSTGRILPGQLPARPNLPGSPTIFTNPALMKKLKAKQDSMLKKLKANALSNQQRR